MSLRAPPRTAPVVCETCRHHGALTYCDWADVWWCDNRAACNARVEEQHRDREVGELDDEEPTREDLADAREEALERRFDEEHQGDWDR
jgi:hypothetical protein